MNKTEQKYTKFALCNEMMDSVRVIKNFNPDVVKPIIPLLKSVDKLLFTGEGSSRIFPAKSAIAENGKFPGKKMLFTEGSTQAAEYDLSDFAVFGASNSGRTKELINLFNSLKNHMSETPRICITSHDNTPLTESADYSCVLSCGPEDAVAATKSVIEQALIYKSLLAELNCEQLAGLSVLSVLFEEVLRMHIPSEWVENLVKAPKIYFAGRNDGTAEELTLKINEITRKPSDFLEGTYVLHGIEEVMNSNEALVLVDPFESEYEMYQNKIEQGVGLFVMAISDRNTPFPTIRIPGSDQYGKFLQLAAGWNLMVETGIASGINPDRPLRARKVGNAV